MRNNTYSPYATSYTRTGKLDMTNRKPYRTAAQKHQARHLARKCEDGTYRSSAPVSYHRASGGKSAA